MTPTPGYRLRSVWAGLAGAGLPWGKRLGRAWLLVLAIAALLAPLLAPGPDRGKGAIPALALAPPGSRIYRVSVTAQQATPCAQQVGDWRAGACRLGWVQNPDKVQTLGEGKSRLQLLGGLVKTLPISRGDITLSPVTYWLGGDPLGRDLLSQLLYAARISLSLGALAVLMALALGLVVGVAAGWLGGAADRLALWGMGVLYALPALVLALVLTLMLGAGLLQLALVIALVLWVDVAKVVRGQVQALRQEDYLLAGRALGLPLGRVLVRHLLPGLWPTLQVLLVANFTYAVLLEAGLSFLGFGAPPPTPSWGRLIADGYPYLLLPGGNGLALLPAFLLLATVLALNLSFERPPAPRAQI